jgi:hypothetical protein
MHFVEVSDVAERTQEIVWEGATRRMTEVMRTETSQLEGELNTKFVGLNTKFAEKLFYGEGARDAGAGTVCGVWCDRWPRYDIQAQEAGVVVHAGSFILRPPCSQVPGTQPGCPLEGCWGSSVMGGLCRETSESLG